jgi:hypothetical protein
MRGPTFIYTLCYGHEKPREQRLKTLFKSNIQIKSKTWLCESKTRTQELKTKTKDVQNKRENISLLC